MENYLKTCTFLCFHANYNIKTQKHARFHVIRGKMKEAPNGEIPENLHVSLLIFHLY